MDDIYKETSLDFLVSSVGQLVQSLGLSMYLLVARHYRCIAAVSHFLRTFDKSAMHLCSIPLKFNLSAW